MDPKALRNSGMAVGGLALAAAVGIATFAGDPQPAAKTERPEIAGPLSRPDADPPPVKAAEAPEAPDPVFETAAAEPSPPGTPLSFLVRFDADHPLVRAQNLAAEGESAEAERVAEDVIRRRRDLRGLCFDRFTIGGAEIVLRPCAEVPENEQDQFRRRWSARFEEMAGVAYAESNIVVRPETRTQ